MLIKLGYNLAPPFYSVSMTVLGTFRTDRTEGKMSLLHLLLLSRDVRPIGPLRLFLAMQPIFKLG